MGGYGSGRRATAPGAADSLAFPLRLLAPALRDLRAMPLVPNTRRHVTTVATWSSGGDQVASVGVRVAEDARGLRCTLRYRVDGHPVEDALALAARPSNLGRGQLWYWRCWCGARARVLYHDATTRRWRCRGCVRVVYASSRASDARVSALLAGAATLAREDWEGMADGSFLATMSAAQLARQVRGVDQALLLALKALDRLGMGLGQPRAPRWHGSTARPRPRARVEDVPNG